MCNSPLSAEKDFTQQFFFYTIQVYVILHFQLIATNQNLHYTLFSNKLFSHLNNVESLFFVVFSVSTCPARYRRKMKNLISPKLQVDRYVIWLNLGYIKKISGIVSCCYIMRLSDCVIHLGIQTIFCWFHLVFICKICVWHIFYFKCIFNVLVWP